jgi:hypothetical protein
VSRSVIAGQTIYLRSQFKDDLGEPAVASGVSVHLFDPTADHPLDVGSAYLNINDPTYIGQGIYEYGFSVPDCAPEGTWHDLWSGMLNCQLMSGEFSFEVYKAGEISGLGSQLNVNNLIEITLTSGVGATDGTYLSEEYLFQFLTTTSPSYTSLRKVRLEVGSLLTDIPDDTIQLSILEASLEADQISFKDSKKEGFFEHARREWTTCKTALTLIDNNSAHGLKSKSLADLRVEYDPAAVMKTIARIVECLQKWEPQLLAGGYAAAAQQPAGVVKGEYDYDRPPVGRTWEYTDSVNSDQRPAANMKGKDSRSRRYTHAFKNNKKWW